MGPLLSDGPSVIAGWGWAGTVRDVKLLRVLAVVAIVAVCGGCQSDVTTAIDLRPDHTTAVVVTATFDGAVADVIDGDVLAELEATWVDRAGVAPDVERDGQTLTVSSAVPYERLVGASTITGIGSLGVTDHDDGTVTVEVVEVVPQLLVDTIVRAADNEPDAAKVASVMLGRTNVTATVTFGDSDVSVTGDATIDGPVVSRTRSLDAAGAQTWSATGSWPTGSRIGSLVWLGVAAVAVAGGVVWRVRSNGPS